MEPEFTAAVEAENATYGDLISLPWLEENEVIANTIKPIEFFTYLARSGQHHPFVSKIDDDSFLNVPAFWDKYLLGRFNSSRAEPCIIARSLYAGKDRWGSDFEYPGGQFYTLSWDLMEVVVKNYRMTTNRTLSEDVFLGKILTESNANFTFVHLPNREAFDYAPWWKDPNGWGHGIAEGAINPHRMKTDEDYLEVAKFFDPLGLNLEALKASET